MSPSRREKSEDSAMALATNLKGKKAVVAGASEGICRAFAQVLAQEGINLCLQEGVENTRESKPYQAQT